MGYNWTGLSYQEKLIGNQAYFIFALSITLVFLVLAAQYESWTNPAAVIITVPMALVGVIVALIVRGFAQRSVYSDRSRADDRAGRQERDSDRRVRARAQGGRHVHRRCGGRSHAPALSADPDDFDRLHPGRRAADDRDGAGAASQQSLGTVVFGGMLASTLLAIPFVSVFYIVMEGFSERRRARKGIDPRASKLQCRRRRLKTIGKILARNPKCEQIGISNSPLSIRFQYFLF